MNDKNHASVLLLARDVEHVKECDHFVNEELETHIFHESCSVELHDAGWQHLP